jgi:hypothetical protein
MTTETSIKTKTLARWLRQRLEGRVPPRILAALTDEELIEQYEEKERRKLEGLKAKHAPPEKQ